MLLNSLIFLGIMCCILFLGELSVRLLPKYFFLEKLEQLKKIDKRLQEYRNLIRLTLLNNDSNTYRKLQKEYAELYNSIIFIKILFNLLFFIPVLIFAIIIYLFFIDWEIIFPPINFIIFLTGIYFVIKVLISLIKNFNIKK